MMRLVFLFFAEENGLLLLGDETYDQFYAASMLRGQLREEADNVGLEVLERRQDAWSRLLATFRAIYAGVDHDALHLPAYGGSLFDPDRFPFLEGRQLETSWVDVVATPLPIDNRTVLHLLDALQVLQTGGGGGEARKLSFRALDIEQIGHVYESLLDHIAVRAAGPMLGLVGPRSSEPEVSLQDLDLVGTRGQAALVQFIASKTKKSEAMISRALAREVGSDAVEALRIACGDDELLGRVLPYHALIRKDPWGEPVIFQAGSIFLTAGPERRGTGTYYTPRVLTEEVVTHALEPLVYHGPPQGKPRDQWELKDPAQLLDLKICDFAMGSGAFLVQTCRWLGERLVEAWEKAGADEMTITVDGQVAGSATWGLVVPVESEERRVLARRLIADRCLYGVDINRLAVEMAKLSLWLVTFGKDRPFSFFDHALKCGDSLLGIANVSQIREFHRDATRGEHLHFSLFDPRGHAGSALAEARSLRSQLESFTVLDIGDAREKATLHEAAERALARVNFVGDMLCGAMVGAAGQGPRLLDRLLADLGTKLAAADGEADKPAVRAEVARLLDATNPVGRPPSRPFHWPIAFPEVFERSGAGFDALVGNPPFMGGVDIATRLGTSYVLYLKDEVPESRGFVDLAVYFHRRAVRLVRPGGVVGLLGPQSLTTTANRRAGTDRILASGHKVHWATTRRRWPGAAAVVVCALCYSPGEWQAQAELNGMPVASINSALEPTADLSAAKRLSPWLDYSQGTDLFGRAFIKSEVDWRPFLRAEPALTKFLRPYVNASILCSTPTFRSDLLAVDFGDRGKEELTGVEGVIAHLEEEVGRERAVQTRQIHEARAWLHKDKRLRAYDTARKLSRVIACPRLSKHLPMALVNPQYLLADGVKILISDDLGVFGLLQSSPFLAWAFATSRMRGGSLAFSTRDSLDTFVPPNDCAPLRDIGRRLWEARRAFLDARGCGMTDLLNDVHDPEKANAGVVSLRELHQELDESAMAAYGWGDVRVDLGFHETPQGVRYTLDPLSRTIVLSRLLDRNAKAAGDGAGPR
jgi:hypothetical protein